MTTTRKTTAGRLRRLFLIDVKRRLINNTPYDVYRLASCFPRETVDVIDLRFHPSGVELPESDSVVLFLETAGTWMCFDWDPKRFIERLDGLLANYRDCTVVGPQARALRTLTGYNFSVIDTLDFQSEMAPESPGEYPAIAAEWLNTRRHHGYNGEHFEAGQMRLSPTFSISYSMNCPLRCDFCFYGDAARTSHAGFAATMRDIERIWDHGHRHFYFMDPNLLPTPSQFDALREFHLRAGGRFTYYCQVSPNYLSDSRLRRFAESGCQGMVIGIENAGRIVAKGSIAEAQERIAQVRSFGMLPMLFFMIDGQHDIEALITEFDPVPFRYTVINHAFASDRSLASIEAGFADKNRLASRHQDLIARLRQKPTFLGRLETGSLLTGAGGVR